MRVQREAISTPGTANNAKINHLESTKHSSINSRVNRKNANLHFFAQNSKNVELNRMRNIQALFQEQSKIQNLTVEGQSILGTALPQLHLISRLHQLQKASNSFLKSEDGRCPSGISRKPFIIRQRNLSLHSKKQEQLNSMSSIKKLPGLKKTQHELNGLPIVHDVLREKEPNSCNSINSNYYNQNASQKNKIAQTVNHLIKLKIKPTICREFRYHEPNEEGSGRVSDGSHDRIQIQKQKRIEKLKKKLRKSLNAEHEEDIKELTEEKFNAPLPRSSSRLKTNNGNETTQGRQKIANACKTIHIIWADSNGSSNKCVSNKEVEELQQEGKEKIADNPVFCDSLSIIIRLQTPTQSQSQMHSLQDLYSQLFH